MNRIIRKLIKYLDDKMFVLFIVSIATLSAMILTSEYSLVEIFDYSKINFEKIFGYNILNFIFAIFLSIFAISRFFIQKKAIHENISIEPTAATERTLAAATNELMRNFEKRATDEINNIAKDLSSKSKELIENSIEINISSLSDDALISKLDEKLSKRLTEQAKWSDIEKEALPIFDQMMRRSLEKSLKSETHSNRYFLYAILFAITGVAFLFIFIAIHYYSIIYY